MNDPIRSKRMIGRMIGRHAMFALAGMLALTGGAAVADGELPPEQSEGAVSYREGGIGIDESSAMHASSDDYPLMLSFAEYEDGAHAYTADVDVRIAEAGAADAGGPALEVLVEGPLLLVDLPPGRYEVTASLEGETQRRTVVLDEQQTQRLYFEWGTPA